MKLLSPSLVLALALPALAQSEQEPIAAADVGGRPLQWRSCDEQPGWVAKPARKAGMFAFATVRRGSNRELAQTRAGMLGERDVRRVLTEHVTPVLGDERASAVVEVLVRHVQLVEAAAEPTRRIPGARGPGQTVGAAYLRWQLPIRAALAELDPQLQGRVEWILLRDVVRWQRLDAPPAWYAAPPARQGYVRLALRTFGEMPAATSRAALAATRSDVRERLLARLAPAVGFRVASAAADRGIDRIAPVQRADWFRRPFPLDGHRPDTRVTTIWTLWEVPMAAMLEQVPEDLREAASVALRGR